MLKQKTSKISVAVGLGVCVLLIGAVFQVSRWVGTNKSQNLFVAGEASKPKSQVTPLALLPAVERSPQLQILASGGNSLDRSRARYLLASDLISQKDGKAALKWLEGLEKDYQVLAPYILLKRAQAYELTGDAAKVEATWQELINSYPNSAVAAEALHALDNTDTNYGDRAIAQFPAHPRTVQIVQKRLKQNPNQPQLLLLLAKHGLYLTDYDTALEKLVNKYASQLTPADWEVIAFGYWEKQDYAKAGAAYAKATRTPRNAYRTGRGLWLGEKVPAARDAYKRMIREFPDAPETGLALLRLARIVDSKEALPYLDAIVRQFPDHAAEALVERGKVLDTLGSSKSAEQARQSVLSQYSNSDAAAELRWKAAKQLAAVGDFQGAWQWAQQLGIQNPESELAPEAGFWVGKWAKRLGRQQDAQKAFEYVLSKYPETYYAWRSAVFLGWEVGDFTTVRPLSPNAVLPEERSVPPAGSELLKELYLLGQDRDAWDIWQVEFTNRMDPTVAEQFTDGLMRMSVGDYIDGMFMLSSLANREKPSERSQYQALKQEPAYWHALYPFPFQDSILTWSSERQLNPLLVTALIRQESRFMPKIRSVVDATGLMQVMPETATWIAQKIKLKQYNLENPDDNIKLGTWFLNSTHQEYNNNSLLAVASYNAGPSNVSDWVARFGFRDPDEFVEKIPFSETRGYVEHVFENYWNYLRLYNPEVSQRLAQQVGGQRTAALSQ